MHGSSRGGMMTYLAIKADTPLNAALVDCGVADVRPDAADDVLARVLPAELGAEERAQAYRDRSALAWPQALVDVPLLITHGAKDAGVPVASVRALQEKLEALGAEHEVRVFPEAGHCGENYPESWSADAASWMERYRVGATAR